MHWLKLFLAALILVYTLVALFLGLFILEYYLADWSHGAKAGAAAIIGLVWIIPIGLVFSLMKRLSTR